MSTKDQILKLIKDLPDDITIEDVQYHLFVKQRLEIAEQQIKDGKLVSSEDVMEAVKKKWLI